MVEISVTITAYNRKDFYMDAIKSVLNQTLPNDKYEIIFVSNFRDAEEFCKKKE
jgi:Glycosyl transferase family 2.